MQQINILVWITLQLDLSENYAFVWCLKFMFHSEKGEKLSVLYMISMAVFKGGLWQKANIK